MHGAIATADMQPVPARPFFHKIIQIPRFLKCVCMFLQRFPSKHGNLHICRHKTVPKRIFTMFPSPLSPQTLEKAAIYTVFFNFSMLANSNIYTKNLQKYCFFPVCLHFFRQKHRNLHVFRLKVGPKHWFLQCFQCSGIQKPFKISLFTVLFRFCPFFPCRKPTKMIQNSVSMAS